MEDLIKALQIFLKYGNPEYPTHCWRNQLSIVGIDTNIVTDEDKDELKRLGFETDEDERYFYSFRFGSSTSGCR